MLIRNILVQEVVVADVQDRDRNLVQAARYGDGIAAIVLVPVLVVRQSACTAGTLPRSRDERIEKWVSISTRSMFGAIHELACRRRGGPVGKPGMTSHCLCISLKKSVCSNAASRCPRQSLCGSIGPVPVEVSVSGRWALVLLVSRPIRGFGIGCCGSQRRGP